MQSVENYTASISQSSGGYLVINEGLPSEEDFAVQNTQNFIAILTMLKSGDCNFENDGGTIKFVLSEVF